MPLSRNLSAIQWTSLETAAYILSSTKISDVASRRCTSGVTQLKTGKFGGSQRMRAESSAEGRPEIDRSCSTTLSLPEIWSWRRRRRHSKNSSRQFQVGLHIITSLQQRCVVVRRPKQKWLRKPKTLLPARRTSVSSETHRKRLL